MKFREYVAYLDERDKLLHIRKEVSVEYEVATLMKMLDGKPLL